jgi:hypothetical protein
VSGEESDKATDKTSKESQPGSRGVGADQVERKAALEGGLSLLQLAL